MELVRYPWDDLTSYDKGGQVSVSVGLDLVAVGYWLDRHSTEWTLQIFLGPVSFRLTRYKFEVDA